MDETLNAVFNLDKNTEIGNGRNLALDTCTGLVFFRNNRPWIGKKLLYPKREPLVCRINIQDNSLDSLPFREDFSGMLDTFCPGYVRDMNQTVNTVLDTDECAEIGNILDLPFKLCSDRIAFFKSAPGIRLSLFKPEGNTAIGHVDPENDGLNRITDSKNFGRMPDTLCPGHF